MQRRWISPSEERYLEIGVSEGNTLERVAASTRVGVDPSFKPTLEAVAARVRDAELFELTSDKFFDRDTSKFSFIFLDGFHQYQQTYRDFVAAINRLQEGGLILVDDTVPSNFFSAQPHERIANFGQKWLMGKRRRPWHGNVYKLVPLVAHFHRDISWVTFQEGNGNTLFFRKRDLSLRIGPQPQPAIPWSSEKPVRIQDLGFLWFKKNWPLYAPARFSSIRLERAGAYL